MSTELKSNLEVAGKPYKYFSLAKAEEKYGSLDKLPFSLKIILEGMLRNFDGQKVSTEDIANLVKYNPASPAGEVPFSPARVLLQDFTGVPLFVDLAAMRDAAKKVGLDPKEINPLVPLDLVIDHSVQVDSFGQANSLETNEKLEMERNNQRFQFLKWAQQAFSGTRIVPPGFGIVHQINMEYLASVAISRELRSETGKAEETLLFDTLVGTDSHTTMVNGLGVFGFGVGGLEAEAAMLGQPVTMPCPEVIGVELTGELDISITATDLALYVTEFLRELNVVGKLVEFYGAGCKSLSLEERATVSNMCPEYGATIGIFPVDEETLSYLRRTGRTDEEVALVEAYYKAQNLWGVDRNTSSYTKTHKIDLSKITPAVSGPRRPQDRIDFDNLKQGFQEALVRPLEEHGLGLPEPALDQLLHSEASSEQTQRSLLKVNGASSAGSNKAVEELSKVRHGDILIAAITSCTNTSNPAVMIGAGLVAKKALEHGLKINSKVKTSLAPGSQAVRAYLEKAGLLDDLEELGFSIVGYGCTTCIGNSGPLSEPAQKAVQENPEKIFASVLSGNRNFDGRIHQHIKANFLMSPPLVVAMALVGNMNFDPKNDPIGEGKNGPVYLKDIWPSKDEIRGIIESAMSPEDYREIYAKASEGTALWNSIESSTGDIYDWDANNTYIQNPPYFDDFGLEIPSIEGIENARCLLSLGDSITTDHISPAGKIAPDSDAANYLRENGVEEKDFNSYGSRRGNDRVMTRGTFANIRLSNLLVPGSSGPRTQYFDNGNAEEMSVFEASLKYKEGKRSAVVFAGKLFGNGSSRDWAAKGQKLLGVKAVIAESFERIHRSNLIGMGILPVEISGKVLSENNLDGSEEFSLELGDDLKPLQELKILAKKSDGAEIEIPARVLLQTPVEVEYYRNGGILQYTLREIAKSKVAS